MYKVLLVEDEQEVLKSMLDNLPWESWGFARPIGAVDGRDAIRILEAGFLPDVIITDIAMPFVDGLELSKYAKDNLKNTIVVILSGYDDFSYAQKAVENDVYKYILKPIVPRKAAKLMKELHEELTMRKLEKKDSKSIVQNHFLNQLIGQELSQSVIKEKSEEYNLALNLGYFAVITLDLDFPLPKSIKERNHLDVMRYALLNITQEIMEDYEAHHGFLGKDGLIKLIINADTVESCKKLAKTVGENIIKTFGQSLDISVTAGIGGVVNQLSKVSISHNQSVEAVTERFYLGGGKAFFYRPRENEEEVLVNYEEYEKEIKESVINFKKSSAEKVVEKLVGELAEMRASPSKSLYISDKLMNKLAQQAGELLKGTEESQLRQYIVGINFSAIFSLIELKKTMLDVVDRTFRSLLEISSNPATVQMIKAEQYIMDNYVDPNLSLNTVTEFLSVSVSYFSNNFKEKTGLTFVEYLTLLRLEKAQQIIKATNKRTYEVAEEVGFSDPHYFSATFKKHIGMSPKDYREKVKEKGDE